MVLFVQGSKGILCLACPLLQTGLVLAEVAGQVCLPLLSVGAIAHNWEEGGPALHPRGWPADRAGRNVTSWLSAPCILTGAAVSAMEPFQALVNINGTFHWDNTVTS